MFTEHIEGDKGMCLVCITFNRQGKRNSCLSFSLSLAGFLFRCCSYPREPRVFWRSVPTQRLLIVSQRCLNDVLKYKNIHERTNQLSIAIAYVSLLECLPACLPLATLFHRPRRQRVSWTERVGGRGDDPTRHFTTNERTNERTTEAKNRESEKATESIIYISLLFIKASMSK